MKSQLRYTLEMLCLNKTLFAAAALLLAWAGISLAGNGHGHDHDHDRARQALEAGEVLPLKAIIERVEGNYPGAIVEVELEREDGRWQYEIKLLRRGGSLLKIKVDARDGSVLGVKGRPGDGRAERSRRRDDERAGVEH